MNLSKMIYLISKFSSYKFLTSKQSFHFTFGTKFPFSTRGRTRPTETTEKVRVEDLEAKLLDALDKLAENYDEEN